VSLIPRLCLSEAGNASKISIADSTGVYDADDNTGGFGTPNIAASAITSAQMIFQFDEIEEPITVDFVITIGSPSTEGVVVSATKTDQLGNVESLDLAQYNIDVFPFPLNDPIVFDADFFFPDALSFPDQYVSVTYTLSDGIETESNDQTFLLNQVSCCCLQKAWLKYAEGKCNDTDPIKIQNAMNGLVAENAVGNLAAARNELKLLKKLCAGCGCGCD
jgi:hypothetical protein